MRRRFANGFRLLAVVGSLLFGGGGCCCNEGPPLLSIWLTPTHDWAEAGSNKCDWRVISWSGTTVAEVGDSVAVIYQDSDDEDEIRTAIELYQGTTRLPLAEATSWDHACEMGCPSPRTLYRLDVPPGEYTLVHRERTGSGKPVHTPNVEAPWGDFDGERALVTILVLEQRAAP
jgi:hypothetical protein